MAMTGAERQRKWLDKNRAMHNLRRRNARKGLVSLEEEPKVEATVSRIEMSSQVPLVYRNDSGGVISKYAWEKLQKAKEDAKKGGYELDEYVQ